ncbi:siderophore-interacting protein [Cryptosporangium sp. NPDC051539]|uniref:siderophore-interacting protein n=1 Tax=Cryptosporangium sp. NPDC051539 TaxID=3363962 RepID=UPI00378E677D
MSNLIERAASRLLTTATVVGNTPVSDALHEVTLTAPQFAGWESKPGQSVRLMFGLSALRTYSIWSRAGSELVLRGLGHHGRGPGSAWMASARAGDTVSMTKPRGVFGLDPGAPWHLFAGDESGSVPLLAMRAELPSHAVVHGVLEGSGADGELPWVSGGLAAAVRSLDLPDEPGVAYLAGEQAVCLEIRRYLREERGWPRRAVRVSAHWAPGKRGLE